MAEETDETVWKYCISPGCYIQDNQVQSSSFYGCRENQCGICHSSRRVCDSDDETSESIKEAFHILKSWNPDWCPLTGHIMQDYSEAEINAVKEEFESAKVLLCAFYREHAWERWARSGIDY